MTANYADPLGYDLSCLDDLDPAMAEVSGALMLGEAAHRRINTPRGALITDPNYGIDVWDLLNAEATEAEVAQVPGLVDQELGKDERIGSSDTTFDTTVTPNTLTTLMQTAAGPYTLTQPVSAITAAILAGGV
jgi:phage baseplate assembly protein W